jgi:hypothetical protein
MYMPPSILSQYQDSVFHSALESAVQTCLNFFLAGYGLSF